MAPRDFFSSVHYILFFDLFLTIMK